MTFPLPGGICRKVCRPKRFPPRQMEPRDVGRLALATVKNGWTPCEVMEAVRAQIQCAKCEAEIQAVDEGLQALEEDAKALLDAILELLESLGIPAREKPPEKGDPEPPWWRRLLRLLNIVAKVRELVIAVIGIYETLNALNQTISRLIADVRELMTCCSKG